MLGPNGEEYNISDANVEAAGGSRGGDNSSLLQGKQQDLTQKHCFVLFYCYLLLPLFSLNSFQGHVWFLWTTEQEGQILLFVQARFDQTGFHKRNWDQNSYWKGMKECVDTESFVIILIRAWLIIRDGDPLIDL